MNYYLDEVEYFHPEVIATMRQAIRELGLDEVLRIDHHLQLENGSVPDLCLIRLSDEKILMPLEVKRTPADVRTSGRRQAQDYAVHLDGRAVDGYYCSTNLELFELFKATSGQRHERILLEYGVCGNFVDGTETVRSNALLAAREIITVVHRNSGVTADTVSAMRDDIVQSEVSLDLHTVLSGIAYEYVRGAFHNSPKLLERLAVARLLPLREYRKSLPVLKESLNQIDFGFLFSEKPAHESVRLPSIDAQEQSFRAGKDSRIEDIWELLESRVLELDPGFVETDHELARSLVHLTQTIFPVRDRVEIWDPGAATGRLLKAAFNEIPGVSLKDLVATEIVPAMGEILTVNLALLDPVGLSPLNAPKIEIIDVCEKQRDEVKGVGLVVMNPPFVAHVRSVERQKKFSHAVLGVKGSASTVASGQIGLEALFLELITELVPEGTIIATVFPHQSLSRRSSVFAQLRQFLLNDFGLEAIFDYPHTSVFEGVAKQTCIMVGRTKTRSESVRFLQTEHDVSRLNLADFANAIVSGAGKISCISVDSKDLSDYTHEGWRSFFPGAPNRLTEVASLNSTTTMQDGDFTIRRGKFGNSGSTKSFQRSTKVCSEQFDYIPQGWWKPGINNVDEGFRVMSASNIAGRCFVPPIDPRDRSSSDFLLAARYIASVYPESASLGTGAQAGHRKSAGERVASLLRDSQFFEGPLTLIPRAARQAMECFLVLDGIIPSTNFICVKARNLESQELLSSWMLTVFAQVQLERLASSENGMRKIEVGTVKQLEVPIFEEIEDDWKSQLRTQGSVSDCLRSSALARRELDVVWAKAIFADQWEDALTTAFVDLVRLVNERRP